MRLHRSTGSQLSLTAARARTADDTPKSTAATTSTRLATSAVRVRSAAFNAEQAPSVAPTDWHAARALQALSYVTPSGPPKALGLEKGLPGQPEPYLHAQHSEL